jgi:dolichyl-phosphate beta-glucosyltransferase
LQKVCIIIPCFNESTRLSLGEFENFISRYGQVDFLFVNDGSTDGTLKMILDFSAGQTGRVSVLDCKKNQGKAEAVRLGINHAALNGQYHYFGFWDADLATPLTEIAEFVADADLFSKRMIIGSRMKRLGAKIERKKSRHLLGRIFSTMASLILRLPVYDSQCGAKIFKKDVLVIFQERFITRWLFDIELLARYRNVFGIEAALGDILERPVTAWIEKGGSKLHFTHMLKVPLELLRIHLLYNRK